MKENKITFWVCISSRGVGYITGLEGGMNAEEYQQILAIDLVNTLRDHGFTKQEAIFQHDNATHHTACSVQNTLSALGIVVMEWPLSSPDLNITETLWRACLRHVIQGPGSNCASVQDFWRAVERTWDSISNDLLRSLFWSMPDRVRAILDEDGGPTRFCS